MSLVRFNNRPANHFFNDFFGADSAELTRNRVGTTPAVNVREDEKNYTIEVAAPGMSKEDFNVEVEKNQLTISSEKEMIEEEKGEKYARKEFFYNSFKRSFRLPKEIKAGKISGKYLNGILEVVIPKDTKAEVSKKIAIV